MPETLVLRKVTMTGVALTVSHHCALYIILNYRSWSLSCKVVVQFSSVPEPRGQRFKSPGGQNFAKNIFIIKVVYMTIPSNYWSLVTSQKPI